jgi:hypothetical protein
LARKGCAISDILSVLPETDDVRFKESLCRKLRRLRERWRFRQNNDLYTLPLLARQIGDE